MPLLVYLSYDYIFPRFAVWVLLLVVAAIDGWRHRDVRSRGYQLFWSLVGVVGLYVVRECVLLACALEAGGGSGVPNTGTFDAYIATSNLADSVWFAILLSIAAGFCITRTSLGPHKTVVIVIPLIFFVTSLVVDYVLYYAKGFAAFNAETAYSADPEVVGPEEEVSAMTGLIFFICIVANMMAFMLAWFYVFDTIQKEREILEGRVGPDAEAAAAAAAGLPPGAAPGAGAGVGHQEIPDEILLEQGQAQDLPVYYGGVVAEDLDAPKTVQDRIETRSKIRLMRQFFYMVSFYVVATLLVLFLPIFVSDTVDKAMVILQNCVLWLFLAALCFIFRQREENPFLLLDEDAGGVGGAETTTELGVLVPASTARSDMPPPPPPPAYNQVVKARPGSAGSSGGGGGGPAPAAPVVIGAGAAAVALPPAAVTHTTSSQRQEDDDVYEDMELQQHFTLGDEEEEHHHDEGQRIVAGPSSSSAAHQAAHQEPAASVNSDAAKQGVLVTVLPSPKLD